MNKQPILVTLTCALVWMLGASTRGESDSYFRRDGGVADDDKRSLPEQFDSKKGFLWRQELPRGNSTPCVHGDFVFLTTHQDQELATVCLDRLTGKVRWKRVIPTSKLEPFHRVGSPASCTPACDGKRVYTFFGSYGLLCYDLDGKPLWERPLGPFQNEFGASSSPILVDGKVILNEDHDINSFLIAIDQKTGDRVWKVARDEFARSYSTPIIWEAGGSKQLVVAGALQLVGYDLKDGSKRWWINGLARIVNPTPVKAEGMLYVASWTLGGGESGRISMEPWPVARQKWDKNDDGKIVQAELPKGPVLRRFFRIDLNQDGGLDESEWTKHARLFELAQNSIMAVRPGGTGNLTKTNVVWRYRRELPNCPSPLAYRGVIYTVKNGGIVTSLDTQRGQLLKRGRIRGQSDYYASPVAGDGKVYLAGEQGMVTVLQAAPKWKILSSHDFGERIMATPVIADGSIYLRTDVALYCFRER